MPTDAPSTSAPRTTKRRASTRARLLASAAEMFAEQGVNAASVEEICARAGFTRGAFYSNFPDKDHLVLALFEQDRAQVAAQLQRVLADPPADVTALMSAVLDSFDTGDTRQRFLMRAEMTLYALRTPVIAEALVRDRQVFRDQLRQAVLDAAARTGRTLEIDPDLLVRTVEALHDGATPQWLLEPGRLPQDSVQSQILPRLVLALSTPVRTPTHPRGPVT